jgi:hypothetical protein
MERTGKTFIIVTDDGLTKDIFLTFKDSAYGCTTVDWLEEMVEFDFADSIEDALHKAELANSMTLGGWPAPMKIAEVLNFNSAFSGDEEPELKTVRTITFHR